VSQISKKLDTAAGDIASDEGMRVQPSATGSRSQTSIDLEMLLYTQTQSAV
jgi:hypothetical protein